MIKISWFCHNSPIIFCGVLMEHFLKITGDSDTTVQSGSQKYQGFLEVFHQITTEYYKWAKRGVRETPCRSKVITPNIHFSALWLCVLILRIKDISSIFWHNILLSAGHSPTSLHSGHCQEKNRECRPGKISFFDSQSLWNCFSTFQDRSKPGRQIVTFLLICNLSIWVIYTFEVQKVEESPVQVSGLNCD